MSTGSDLSGAFGRPALTERLGRNPRRTRRDQGDQGEQEDADNAAPPAPAGAPADLAPSSARTPPTEPEANERETDPPEPRGSAVGSTAAAPTTAEAPPARARTGGESSSRRSTSSSGSRRASAGRPRGGGRAPQDTDLDANISYAVPVYVHPAVRTAAMTRRKEDKLTNAQVAFDALDEVQHRLPGLIRDRRLQARPENSLFPGRIRRGRLGGGGAAQTAGDARRVLWQFRATGAELEIIDRLIGESGAESRSELIAVAMEETLLR